MGDRTGNPTWVDSATVEEAQENPSRMITAAKLNAIEDAIDEIPVVTISEDYVLTIE